MQKKFLLPSLLILVLLVCPLFTLLPAYAPTYLWDFSKWDSTFRIVSFAFPNGVITTYSDSEQFQFNITLSRRPAINSVAINIERYNLSFYYQPPLDEELNVSEYTFVNATHAFNGSILLKYRPENVVGSYAVYGLHFGNEYQTGKLFHLYRPLLIDAKGSQSWATVNVTNNVLTLTADMTFLVNAVYPVVIDPTFGITSAGGSWTGVGSWGLVATRFQLYQDGTVTAINAYLRRTSSSNNSRIGSYTDKAGPLPDALKEGSNDISISSAAWYSFNTSTSYTAGWYWLSTYLGDAQCEIAYDSNGETRYVVMDVISPYGAMPNPWPVVSSGSNLNCSFYADYTTGAEPGTYIVDLTETFTIGLTNLEQTAFHIVTTQSFGIALTTYARLVNFVTLTLSSTLGLVQTIRTAYNVILTAGVTSTLTTLIRSAFNVVLTSTWTAGLISYAINATAVFNHFIVDLALNIATSLLNPIEIATSLGSVFALAALALIIAFSAFGFILLRKRND